METPKRERTAYDDQLDSFAQACARRREEEAERLKREHEEQERQRRDQEFETELRQACGNDERLFKDIMDDRDRAWFVDLPPQDLVKRKLEERAERKVEHLAWRRRVLLSRGIPELHLRHVYDKAPEEDDALRFAREFKDSDDLFLVLSGGLGTRKTGAACWLLTQLKLEYSDHFRSSGEDNDTWRFISADDYSKSFGFDDKAQKLDDDLRSVNWLVLDDLGTEFNDAKGWFAQHFNSLMNYRYSNMKRTIITTNQSVDEFKKLYPRVWDRIRETGRFLIIGGASKRQKKAKP